MSTHVQVIRKLYSIFTSTNSLSSISLSSLTSFKCQTTNQRKSTGVDSVDSGRFSLFQFHRLHVTPVKVEKNSLAELLWALIMKHTFYS